MERLTIDEAIAFCHEKSSSIKLKAEPEVFVQLEELMEELNKRRSEDYGYMADIHQSIGYRKALDDIKEELMKNGFICTQHALDVFDGIAKQLKEGN